MRERKQRYFVGDFETTVYKGQEITEVWAAAVVEMYSEDVQVYGSIDELYQYLKGLKENIVIYFHNLKFDGNFWISYLHYKLGYAQAFEYTNNEKTDGYFLKQKEMENKTYSYVISDMGQWYSIKIKINNHIIEIRDSYKLLPFSVKKIGIDFKTAHQKSEIEYEGIRFANCRITEEEQKYIKNDVLVVKEALEIMFNEGHNKLTIGACCLAEYKGMQKEYECLFPNMYEYKIDKGLYGAETAGEYIHRAYRGGWCYLVPEKANEIKRGGCTADVNSLYPSMMHSESGNKYPVGKPTFWVGAIPEVCWRDDVYFYVKISTKFYIKPGKLPFVQIKGNYLYKGTEMLETSDVYIYNYATGRKDYYREYKDREGNIRDTAVELTLTCTDYALLKEHYTLVDMQVLNGCWYEAKTGIFDEYIDKYKKIKMESSGAIREIAKLFSNNLYGKMAASTNSSFKLAIPNEEGTFDFREIEAYEKKPGYIPIGAAITSYARCFTIRAAQQNYYGKHAPGFIYADTDSIHCDMPKNALKGIKIDDARYCCWKIESEWDRAIFVRQKTYIEHVIENKKGKLENGYYEIKCAGMPDKCKDLFNKSMDETYTIEQDDKKEKYSEEEKEFLRIKRSMNDFKVGLRIPGKLMPRRIPGGIVLQETTYELRPMFTNPPFYKEKR